MASRIERNYSNDSKTSKRTQKNSDLYKTIYEDEAYSNIEAVVENPSFNEVNIDKIKEILLKQEIESNHRSQLVKKDLDIPKTEEFTLENKNYDIRDILAKAKIDSDDEVKKPRSLREVDAQRFNKNLDFKEKYSSSDVQKDLEELRDLISTIAGNNKDLNMLADKDLSLDMFSDLASQTNEINNEQTGVIKKLIAEAKRIEEKQEELGLTNTKPLEVDKSFYTSTLKLRKKDFEDQMEKEEEIKSNLFFKVFIILVVIIIITAAVITGYFIIK